MKLLRNVSLLETKQWREAVDVIFEICWKHARIDEDNADMLQHCTAELLFNLLKRENQREYGLKLFFSTNKEILSVNKDEMDDAEDDLYASSDDDDMKIPAIAGIAGDIAGIDGVGSGIGAGIGVGIGGSIVGGIGGGIRTGLDVEEDTKLAIALSASQMDEKKEEKVVSFNFTHQT